LNALLSICSATRAACNAIAFCRSLRRRERCSGCATAFSASLKPTASPCDASASRAKAASPIAVIASSPKLNCALAGPEAPACRSSPAIASTSHGAKSAIRPTTSRPSPRTKSFRPTMPIVKVAALASR